MHLSLIDKPGMNKVETVVNAKLCTYLGAQALSTAPKTLHTKWTHNSPLPPPPSPILPHGSLWSLVNHIKVLHQYTSLLSEAASGQGVHSPLLCGSEEMCQTHSSLAWFSPLCCPINSRDNPEYQKHIDIWRQANPGLYSHSEAAYHVHQGYTVEDRNMTRFLVSRIMQTAKEYEVDIAGNILRARPASYDEFYDQFINWRRAGLYHPLCLAARNLPNASQWVPKSQLHEAGDWQDLLDQFNESSFCSKHRMAAVCESLIDRSPMLCNHICAMLDRVAILIRVKSNPTSPTGSRCLDDYMHMLQLPIDESSPYTHCLATWGKLRQIIEEAVPPSLMCPSLYPPSNRGAWGYSRMDLAMQHDLLCIQPSPLQWIEKGTLQKESGEPKSQLPDRLYDILTRMGEAATSPEIAHLMLSPKTMMACLGGSGDSADSIDSHSKFTDRDHVIQNMANSSNIANTEKMANVSNITNIASDAHFIGCIEKLVACLPVVGVRQFPGPKQFLAWRVDLPPRVLLYQGSNSEVDLSSTPPYLLPKISLQDKLQNRTLSGISIIQLDADVHTTLRALIAEEIIGPHTNFADHPHHKVAVKVGPGKTEILHTTTLAEAVSLFTGPPPYSISKVALHESAPWDEDHIDDRYAECQVAANGTRLRDWATIYHADNEIQRCRMASHAVTCSEVYETHFPLSGQSGQSGQSGHKWVSVASTLPAETRVLRNMGGNTSLEVLRRSVESRFMHDGKLLPVRSKEDRVDRAHMELYSDSKSGQVLLAYAPISPDGSRKEIEFMSFRHC